MQINLVENGAGAAAELRRRAIRFRRRARCPPTADQSGFFRLSRAAARRSAANLQRTGDLPGRELLPLDGAAARISASPRAACRSAPATRAARNFRSSAPSGSRRPTLAANALTIHALLDSESVTGAYRFTLRPGEATIIDTECSLFPRADDRSFRPRDDERDQPVQPARPARRRRRPRRGGRNRPVCRCSPAPANGSGGRSPTATPCRFPTSSTKSQGLRLPAAQSRLRRFQDDDSALGAPSLAVDRADRRLGRGLGATGRNSVRHRERTRTSSPSGARKRRSPRASRPISPIASSGAGRRRRARRSPPSPARAAARRGGQATRAFWSSSAATLFGRCRAHRRR